MLSDLCGCSTFNPYSAECFLPFPQNFGAQLHVARSSSCLGGLVGVKSLFRQGLGKTKIKVGSIPPAELLKEMSQGCPLTPGCLLFPGSGGGETETRIWVFLLCR